MLAAEMRTGGDVGAGRAEALRVLDVAEQLLGARDLAGSRDLAERAMEVDPLLEGPERVLAAADVLLAAQRRRVNNHVDWYAVLQLNGPAEGAASVRLQYRRLALLLRPDPRRGSFSLFSSLSAAVTDEAFKLVCDAWAVLSDPAKKELYDMEIEIAATAAEANRGDGGGQNGGETAEKKASVEADIDTGGSFWTACTICCTVYQYARGYEGRSLLCHNCGKAFQATEMASPPPVVPGMDMYFCSWGLCPLGFPGGPNFVLPTAPNPASVQQVVREGRKKKQSSDSSEVDEDWEPRGARKKKQNQRSSAGRKGRANGKLVGENVVCNWTSGTPSASQSSPRKTRAKVMAQRGKQQVASVEESGVVGSGAAEVDVDPANKDNGETRPDGMKNAPKSGCSRPVEVSMEDLNLNFAIDVNAAAAIIESMGMSTLTFSKDEDVVVVDQLW